MKKSELRQIIREEIQALRELKFKNPFKKDHLYKIYTNNGGGFSGLWDHDMVAILNKLKIKNQYFNSFGDSRVVVKNITPEQKKKFEKAVKKLDGDLSTEKKTEYEEEVLYNTNKDYDWYHSGGSPVRKRKK